MGAHTIHRLLSDYGCALVFAVVALQALGAPLPGTTVLIAAAVVAGTRHSLPIAGVIAAGAGGAVVGTGVGFAVGRWGGPRLLERLGRRLGQRPERVARLRVQLAASGPAWLFVARFVTGLRNVAGLVAGASGVPVARFLVVTTAAALAWALLNALEYYWFGRALAGAETWVQIVLICLGLAWMLVSLRFLGRRALRRLATAPEPPRVP